MIAHLAMSEPLSPLPFRWNVAKRDELGSLLRGERGELGKWISWHLGRSAGARIVELGNARAVEWFFAELLRATARILALSDDGGLFFVGRSPENFYDFLSGVFHRKHASPRIQLLPFSVGSADNFESTIKSAKKRRQLERSLAVVGLAPRDIVARRNPTVLVDIVSTGQTLGCLVKFLHQWSAEQRLEWRQMRQKLRIVGMTERTKTSPKTWRWQQHAGWTELLARNAIKNVSIPYSLFHYIGAGQPKLQLSFSPTSWDDPSLRQPRRGDDIKMAVRLARALHVAGKREQNRLTLVRLMSDQPAVRSAWFRRLMREIRAQ